MKKEGERHTSGEEQCREIKVKRASEYERSERWGRWEDWYSLCEVSHLPPACPGHLLPYAWHDVNRKMKTSYWHPASASPNSSLYCLSLSVSHFLSLSLSLPHSPLLFRALCLFVLSLTVFAANPSILFPYTFLIYYPPHLSPSCPNLQVFWLLVGPKTLLISAASSLLFLLLLSFITFHTFAFFQITFHHVLSRLHLLSKYFCNFPTVYNLYSIFCVWKLYFNNASCNMMVHTI